MVAHRICLILLVLLVSGCSSQPVYAPVGSRDNERKPVSTRPTVTKSAPSGTGYRAASGRTAARSNSSYHVVRRGETLYSIAWKYGLSYRELASINRIRAPYTIYAGQRLRTGPYPQRQTASASAGTRPPPAQGVTRTAPAARPAAQPSKKPAAEPVAQTAAATTSSTTTATATKAQPVENAGKALPASVQQWVWPTRGRVLQGYAADNAGKKGIDIGGISGQSVVAAADGKVVYAGSGLVGYGRLIIIKHTESLLSAYGHNSELLVSEGQHVKAGQTIARMGNSGTDGTQLYFEIRKDGKPVNPLLYLPEA